MTMTLLVIFQIKHYLADYLFQTPYMLGKFKKGTEWIAPLCAHCGVHALFTLSIVGMWTHNFKFGFALALFDFVAHFIMDRIKASPSLMGRWKALSAAEYASASDEQKASNTKFWYALGFDQMVHHLTHYAIIAAMILYMEYLYAAQ